MFLSRTGFRQSAYEAVIDVAQDFHDTIDPPPPPPPEEPQRPKYKEKSAEKVFTIIDNFPIAAEARSAADLPFIPSWNKPPHPHVKESTPLLIGFTRNWRILQQVIVSYITAGWPPSDIYVVENTGVMDSNAQGRLSLQNPFFLNHTRLTMLGVNVITTPTLLTFAQLQNYFTYTAMNKGWATYWWGHMDAIIVGDEEKRPYRSVYQNAVEVLREVSGPDFARHPETNQPGNWAIVFHAYDQLALVNTTAYLQIGGWDTQIPYYMTDCDMHARLRMAGYEVIDRNLGGVWDVAGSLDDLIALYRKASGPQASFLDPETGIHTNGTAEIPTNDEVSWPTSSLTAWQEDTLNSTNYHRLKAVAEYIMGSKHSNSKGRNTWQARQMGGQGDPFFRDSAGFEQAILMAIQHGREVFSEKWGHRDCDIFEIGLKLDDAWQLKHDWESQPRRRL